MDYVLNYSNGRTIIIPPDSINSNTTSISLPGDGYVDYGLPIDQSLLSMLENFASGEPSRAITGQTWFNTATQKLLINTSNTGVTWTEVGGSPGGSNTQIQFNNSGTFGGTANLTFNSATNTLSTTNIVITNSATIPNLISNVITTGSSSAPGTITGNWTLTSGSALNATYADLAENYVADRDYSPGTVLEFGGKFEVTVAEDGTRRIAGVVSSNPAYLMNSDCQGEIIVAVALQGRTPCLVRGKIKKGDMLVSGGDGYARPSNDPSLGSVVGKSLEDFEGEGMIEVVVGRL